MGPFLRKGLGLGGWWAARHGVLSFPSCGVPPRLCLGPVPTEVALG